MKIKLTSGIMMILTIIITHSAFADVTINGFCYLEGGTNHSGTKVLFNAVSPTAVTDSTYTLSDGSFNIGLSVGIYTISYSHDGWQPHIVEGDVQLFANTTLDEVTLSFGEVQDVSGNQSGTWTSNYIYNVIGDINVPAGDSLIIEPGVTVKFLDYYSFTINGKLIAEGTETDSIRFTSGQAIANPGDWGNFKFDSDSDDSSVITYAKIEYAYSISCYGSSPTISNNTISKNSYCGIYCTDGSLATISNNTISNNTSTGISCYDSSPTISNNTINNNEYGIRCNHDSSPPISNNTISNNHYGIWCDDSFSTISNNTISNNTSTGIRTGDYPLTISNNVINNNYNGIELSSYNSSAIRNNTISNNFRGILNYSSSATILNNIFYTNVTGIDASSSSPPSLETNLFWLNQHVSSGDALPPAFGQLITVNANGDP